jgi:glucokinase
MLLAGDIGGTKTILALFSADEGPRRLLAEAIYPSSEYLSLEAMIEHFLQGKDATVERAGFGVAGPVINGRSRVTNLAWSVDTHALSHSLDSARVTLLNDLEAIATAVPFLEGDDLVPLKPGEAEPAAPIAIIAPGTGLGEAFLLWDGQHYRPRPSEGGHADFAPSTPLELELLAYLQPRLGHVSYERVCSGIGIPNLYAFLRDSGRHHEPDWLRQQLIAAKDQTPIIMDAAVAGTADICVEVLNLFLSILGSESGNLVLKLLATGGVYLGGGIPPRLVPQLKDNIFLDAFARKGRFSGLMARVPVNIIVHPRAGLLGAAYAALAD